MGIKTNSFAAALQELAPLKVDVSAARLTTFGLGGVVKYVSEPTSVSMLSEVVQFLQAEGVNYRILGAGSNLIISDQGISEVVIRFGRGFNQAVDLKDTELELSDFFTQGGLEAKTGERSIGNPERERVFAFAGASLMSLSRRLSQRGLSGLEFAAGIPASIGGSVYMNAGAHGESISDCLSRALVLDSKGELRLLEKAEVGFSYRSNSLPENTIILGAEFELSKGEAEQIEKRRSECLQYRRQTQPLHLPSAGSVFRNPSATTSTADSTEAPAAAQLLEKVGMKGYCSGGVGFSEMHSNWLVKVSQEARAADAVGLIDLAQSRVESEYGLTLKPEIKIWQ